MRHTYSVSESSNDHYSTNKEKKDGDDRRSIGSDELIDFVVDFDETF